MNFIFDEELLKELFPGLDFTFTDEEGNVIEVHGNDNNHNYKQKKKNLDDWTNKNLKTF